MKQVKRKRYSWYLLSRLLSRGGAIFGVGMTYGLFTQHETQTTQLNGMASLTIILVFFFFYKDLKGYIATKAQTAWSDAVDETKWLVVIVVLLGFIQWAKTGLFNLEELLLWIGLAQLLSIWPSMQHRNYLRIDLKNEKKKQEEKEKTQI